MIGNWLYCLRDQEQQATSPHKTGTKVSSTRPNEDLEDSGTGKKWRSTRSNARLHAEDLSNPAHNPSIHSSSLKIVTKLPKMDRSFIVQKWVQSSSNEAAQGFTC